MNNFDIIMICEGIQEPANLSQYIKCWSELGKKGLYKNLQGFFGRELQNFIDAGLLNSDFSVNTDIFFDMTGQTYQG